MNVLKHKSIHLQLKWIVWITIPIHFDDFQNGSVSTRDESAAQFQDSLQYNFSR